MAEGAGGIPPLSLSSGPAVSDAQSGGGSAFTGAFFTRPQPAPSLIERAAPWIAIAGVAWLIIRK